MSTPGAEDLIKHLEFIQAIIARQASNSFLLKAWSVTLVGALFALAAKDADARFAYLPLVPVLVFWGLDAYYLYQENRFRDLYNWVRKGMEDITPQKRQAIGPFSLQPDEVPPRHRSRGATWRAVFSRTIVPFYLVLCLCVVGAARLASLQSPTAKSQAPSKPIVVVADRP